MANVRNVAAPCAWSADFYDLSRNAYRNNDLRVKMLHLTTAYYVMFRRLLGLDCLGSNL